MSRWLPSYMLGQISDGDVDRIRGLVPKLRQLCLVGRNDEGDNGTLLSLISCLDCLL